MPKPKIVDLKVFYSSDQQQKEPDGQQFQKCWQNVKAVSLLPPSGYEEYQSDWVYLSLYSVTGCSIQISVQFKDEDRPHKLINRKKIPLNYDDLFSDNGSPRHTAPANELIARNIEIVQNFNPD